MKEKENTAKLQARIDQWRACVGQSQNPMLSTSPATAPIRDALDGKETVSNGGSAPRTDWEHPQVNLGAFSPTDTAPVAVEDDSTMASYEAQIAHLQALAQQERERSAAIRRWAAARAQEEN